MSPNRFMAAASTSAVLALGVALAGPVAADGFSVPTDTVVVAEPGSSVELGRTVVDTTLAGPDCTWTASAQNQESVHLGNNIVISSGGQQLTLTGVEDVPNKVTSSSGSAYLTEEIVAVLQMGPDGVFSGGISLTISYDNCQPEPPTTQAPTTVVPAAEPPTPVTSAPAPPSTATPTTPAVEVAPQGPSTTMAPATTTSTTSDVTAGPVLPVTGSGLLSMLGLVGGILLATGIALARWVRFNRPAS